VHLLVIKHLTHLLNARNTEHGTWNMGHIKMILRNSEKIIKLQIP